MNLTLSEFLLARIDEDEKVARAATSGPWYWEEPQEVEWPQNDQSLRSRTARAKDASGQDLLDDADVLLGWGHDASGIKAQPEDRAHIVRWAPDRVLVECEAKRRLVKLGAGDVAALRLLATVYVDHPDYRQEWKP